MRRVSGFRIPGGTSGKPAKRAHGHGREERRAGSGVAAPLLHPVAFASFSYRNRTSGKMA